MSQRAMRFMTGGGGKVYSSSVQCPKRAMRFTTGGGGGGRGIFLLSTMSQKSHEVYDRGGGGGGERYIPPQYNVPKEP